MPFILCASRHHAHTLVRTHPSPHIHTRARAHVRTLHVLNKLSFYLFQVSTNSTENAIVCECSHMSAFSGSFFVKPNKLDLFEMRFFLHFFQNIIIILTVTIAWCLYIILIVWARRKDRHDREMVRIFLSKVKQ